MVGSLGSLGAVGEDYAERFIELQAERAYWAAVERWPAIATAENLKVIRVMGGGGSCVIPYYQELESESLFMDRMVRYETVDLYETSEFDPIVALGYGSKTEALVFKFRNDWVEG